MRIPLLIATLATVLAAAAPASARSLGSRRPAKVDVRSDGNARAAILGIVEVALEVRGRLQMALRSSEEIQEAVRALATFEKIASIAVPRFRIPLDIHPMPVLVERPADGALSSPFGVRREPIRKRRKRFHRGLDFYGKRGQPVRAAGAGYVTRARRNGSYGRVVFIDHGLGLETRYAHLHRLHVSKGDFVPAGALVGSIGSTGRSTGPHLHFEVRMRGAAVDPKKSMDIELFASERHWTATLASMLAPKHQIDRPAEAKKPKRKRRRARRSRSQRLVELW